MSARQNPLYTIGHSTHAIEVFLELLARHDVTAVADVRSMPYSRVSPQFNKYTLKKALAMNNIRYVYLGRELGARSEDPSCYENGRVKYARLARTELFRRGIQRVLRGAQQYRIALLCAEKEPLECHRALLVGQALHENGALVRHILEDGRTEAHDDAIERLLDLFEVSRADLFHSREDLVADALARQEERVAWVNKEQAAHIAGETP